MRTVTPAPAPDRVRRALVLLALAALPALAAACGTKESRPPTFPPVTTPPPAETAEPGASGSASPSSPVPASDSPTPSTGADRPDLAAAKVALEPVTDGIPEAIFATGANDGTDRLFVATQGGTIRIVEDDVLRPDPFVDLSARISAGGERGLLGLAFPPGFGPERPRFFVHYSDRNGDTVIAELSVTADDANRADPASEREILAVKQPYANHNGGWIGFDGDGMLLVALGDGGSGGDPENRASNPGELLGKMLRIDVLGATGDRPYVIPADNPFVGQAGTREEILHYGLRNPFRSSVDLETGDLWIGDVGQNKWEEVSVARAGETGLDFGWRRWEGSHCYDEAAGCVREGVTMPVTEYPHAEGCSVIGGVVYRGDAIPALRGAYLFGDFCSGKLWALDAAFDGTQAPILLLETGLAISSINTDDSGEIYLTDLSGGALLRLVGG